MSTCRSVNRVMGRSNGSFLCSTTAGPATFHAIGPRPESQRTKLHRTLKVWLRRGLTHIWHQDSTKKSGNRGRSRSMVLSTELIWDRIASVAFEVSPASR